jgi:hypothetical protein
MAIASVLGRSVQNLSIALVFVSWPIYCRLMRGQVLTEKRKPYVAALTTLGVGHTRMIDPAARRRTGRQARGGTESAARTRRRVRVPEPDDVSQSGADDRPADF